MLRSRALVLAVAAIAARGVARAGVSDPIFATVPFEEWFQQAGQTRFHWTEHVLSAELSVHQRLVAQVEVKLDGRELARRRGEGQLLILCQFKDASGGTWQDHGTIDLEKVEQGIRASDVSFTESAFVRPGDYGVSIAIFDTATGEHAVRRDKLHVAALANDPLPRMWENLPSIEFIRPAEAPDSWFLPSIRGRLNLPLEHLGAAQLETMVNLTPSEHVSGSFRVRDRNLGALLPSLKVISQIKAPGVPFRAALLDLTRRRVPFEQEISDNPGRRRLTWAKMRDALTETNPGSIDVKALEDRQHNAAFFVAEVARRVRRSRALIILSSPVEFESGQDLQPIHMETPPDCQIFYIRYQPARLGMNPAMRRTLPALGPAMGRPGMGPGPGIRPGMIPINDQLAATLKPLAPRLFDVQTPEQFRRALAAILSELAKSVPSHSKN